MGVGFGFGVGGGGGGGTGVVMRQVSGAWRGPGSDCGAWPPNCGAVMPLALIPLVCMPRVFAAKPRAIVLKTAIGRVCTHIIVGLDAKQL
jgi:hypothetical protein